MEVEFPVEGPLMYVLKRCEKCKKRVERPTFNVQRPTSNKERRVGQRKYMMDNVDLMDRMDGMGQSKNGKRVRTDTDKHGRARTLCLSMAPIGVC